MKRKSMPYALIPLLFIIVFSLAAGPLRSQATDPAQSELDAVWQRVHQSGAYRFNADVTQTTTPLATTINAGRKANRTTLYLQGETDIDAESLHLSIWTNGGSVLVPESGVEVRIDGDEAVARKGNGAWEEVEDFTGLFAPGGDFMAYVRAAENVVNHGAEIRSTVAGDIPVTLYTFDIDGRTIAEAMRAQLMEQARADGLPTNVHMELPKVYADMTGTGELWVGADGLPLRQKFELAFPPTPDDYATTARMTVDFSDFAPLPVATLSYRIERAASDVVGAVTAPSNVVPWLGAMVGLFFMGLMVAHRRSRHVYTAVALSVILSMLVVPLLTSRQISAYSATQAEKQAASAADQTMQENQAEMQAQMRTPSVEPHVDPLAVAQTLAAAQVDEDGRYFDSSCETDPAGDLDADGLTNLSECLLGTLPTVTDTDSDGVTDKDEVEGFSYNDQTWYLDPLNHDTNYDGNLDGKEWHLDADGSKTPDDTDGDGTPDLWDDDNDGDGVRDSLDLSPYANTKGSAPYSGSQPFELAIDNLTADELVRVEFQFRPTDANHLWYSQSVLDWPDNDHQGQIQDSDGATFYDVDNTLTP